MTRRQALAYRVLQLEADLRFALVRVREHAESVAFYSGGGRERGIADGRLGSLVDTAAQQLRVGRSPAASQKLGLVSLHPKA